MDDYVLKLTFVIIVHLDQLFELLNQKLIKMTTS